MRSSSNKEAFRRGDHAFRGGEGDEQLMRERDREGRRERRLRRWRDRHDQLHSHRSNRLEGGRREEERRGRGWGEARETTLQSEEKQGKKGWPDTEIRSKPKGSGSLTPGKGQ